MAGKRRVKADVLPTPKTRDEAEALIGRMGAIRREVAVIDAALEEKVAAAKRDAEQAAQPLKTEAAALFAALEAWATANRETLMPGPVRSARLGAGTLGWRTTPPSVRIEKPESVLAILLGEDRFRDFVRTKVEIDRRGMLDKPVLAAQVPGVSIVRRTEFFVEPVGAETSSVLGAVTGAAA